MRPWAVYSFSGYAGPYLYSVLGSLVTHIVWLKQLQVAIAFKVGSFHAVILN